MLSVQKCLSMVRLNRLNSMEIDIDDFKDMEKELFKIDLIVWKYAFSS